MPNYEVQGRRGTRVRASGTVLGVQVRYGRTIDMAEYVTESPVSLHLLGRRFLPRLVPKRG
jgi:hypothetical protein